MPTVYENSAATAAPVCEGERLQVLLLDHFKQILDQTLIIQSRSIEIEISRAIAKKLAADV
jgi:hypothetical protein